MVDRHHTITLEGATATFTCRPDETVTDAMERSFTFAFQGKGGKRIAVGCRRGGCGICRVQVLSGSYRVEAQSRAHVSEEEQAAGFALACRLVPQGDLTLRLAAKAVPAKKCEETITTS